MMFYEFSENELLMSKLLSNIYNVQLDYLMEEKEKKKVFLLWLYQINADYLTISNLHTWVPS